MADPEIIAIREQIAARTGATDIAQRRIDSDARGKSFRLPADVRVEKIDAGGVPAEWTSTPDSAADRVILYLHGGGYVFGSLDSHRHVAAEAGRQAGTRVLAIDYRLAPEHPFPAPVEDSVAAYRFLLGRGIRPGNVALAGDSAGGGLVVAAMLAIRDAGLTLPACGWCISPWVDMEARSASFTDRAETDPTVQKAGILDLAALYLNGADPRHPHAAPVYGDLRGLPPLFIQVGAVETLLDDALWLAREAGKADVPVDLQVWPEMIHVWHQYHQVLGAGRRALEAGGTFIKNHLEG
ncbi:MAG TPA: alpha/beta hydrolase [Rhodopila sp.]|uniref:alpha/beta hydrolase n=1 Tax=Rhodopila sp. TaxID=2480087 RepID=UPI002CADDE87|nr:alpha/beta hydrolase [Rhodopila sp.]HVY16459.1 alpha/beta hydrolase [Rhodopila sp.]